MQTEIYTKQRLGINGQISKAESQYLATIQGVAIEDLTIGAPVIMGEQDGEVKAINDMSQQSIGEKFLGFVVRDGYIPSCETPTEIYKAGRNVTIITKGSLFLNKPAETEPKQGQRVSISKADGGLNFVDNGAGETSGSLDSIWRVSAVEGDIIEITTQF